MNLLTSAVLFVVGVGLPLTMLLAVRRIAPEKLLDVVGLMVGTLSATLLAIATLYFWEWRDDAARRERLRVVLASELERNLDIGRPSHDESERQRLTGTREGGTLHIVDFGHVALDQVLHEEPDLDGLGTQLLHLRAAIREHEKRLDRFREFRLGSSGASDQQRMSEIYAVTLIGGDVVYKRTFEVLEAAKGSADWPAPRQLQQPK